MLSKQGGDFICKNLLDIQNKIIPFFNKYAIIGVKSLDFKDWCLVAELMQEGKHTTPEGL